MIALIGYVVGLLLGGWVGYKIGWSRREKIFQENSIQYIVGAENAAHVARNGATITISVQNKRLVKVVYLK